VVPTDHTSVAEKALTDVNEVFAPAGRGKVSRLHADPSHRNATAALELDPMVRPTANAVLDPTESTSDSTAQVLPPVSRSGLATTLHRVPL
jgi:hypothetical protein